MLRRLSWRISPKSIRLDTLNNDETMWLPVDVQRGWEQVPSGVLVAWDGWARGSDIHWVSLHSLMSRSKCLTSNRASTLNSVSLKNIRQYCLSSSDLTISCFLLSAFKFKCKSAPFAPALKCIEGMIQSTCSTNSRHVLTGLKGAVTAVAQRLHFL